MNLLQKIFYGLALLLITLTIMLDRASGSVGTAGFAQVPSSKYYFPVITSGNDHPLNFAPDPDARVIRYLPQGVDANIIWFAGSLAARFSPHHPA